MLVLHILAGSIALLAGFAALYSRKGAPLHRRAGTTFAIAMLTMAGLGTAMAAASDEPGTAISVVAGALAFHLTGTGWLTVRPPARGAQWLLTALTLLGALVVARAAWLVVASEAAGGRIDGVPTVGYAIFGSLALLATLLDVRVVRGARLDGRARLARHLWRMGVALLIATASFFLGQADEFPAWLRHGVVTAGPPLAVLATVLGYLAKTKWPRRRQNLPEIENEKIGPISRSVFWWKSTGSVRRPS